MNINLDTETKLSEFDIVIIGYGMVGSIAALLAVKYHLKVAVLEVRKCRDLYVPKAGRIDAEVMRIFEQLGVKKDLEEKFHPLNGTQVVDLNENVIFDIVHPCTSGHAPMYGIYQPEIQSYFHNKLAIVKNDFTLFEMHRAEAFEQNKDRVKIIAHDLENDIYFEMNTRFLIACNGQESLVPAQCDLKYRYLDYSNYYLNVDTITKEELVQPHKAKTIIDTEYPVTGIFDSGTHQRWEFRLDPDAMADKNVYKKVRSILDGLIPVDFELVNTYLYTYETRILEEWKRKRIFITGDAAHVIPPYLGLGLAAGIKDVYNLIWKIALVADRRVKGRILDSYQPEREYNVLYLMKINMRIQKLFKPKMKNFWKSVFKFLPLAFSQKKISINTKIKTGFIGFNHDLKGTYFPTFKFKVPTNGLVVSADNVLADDFVLLSFGNDPVDALSPSNIEYCALIGFRFVKIYNLSNTEFLPRYSELFLDNNDEFTTWCKKNKITYLIVRPDKLIFDAAKDENHLDRVFKNLKKQMPLRKRETD